MEVSSSEDFLTNVTTPETNELFVQMPLVQECLDNPIFQTITTIATSTTFVTTLFGNLLVIVSILKFKVFHKGVTHKLILHVAIADLVLMAVLITYPIEKLRPSYLRIPTVCLIRPIFTSISFSASITFLTFISIDRFVAVMFPLRHMLESKKKWRIRVFIMTVWAVSILTGVVTLKLNMFDRYGYKGEIDGCPVAWYGLGIMLSISMTFVFFSLIINFASYFCVIYRLMRRNVEFNFESKQKQMSKTRLLLIVYIVFTLFWLPNLVCQAWLLVYPENVTAKCYREYFFLPGFVNSGLNWIFYGFGNRKYRLAFGKLLCPWRKG